MKHNTLYCWCYLVDMPSWEVDDMFKLNHPVTGYLVECEVPATMELHTLFRDESSPTLEKMSGQY